jgi:ABC-type Fe3+ transport system substrate-binding protein
MFFGKPQIVSDLDGTAWTAGAAAVPRLAELDFLGRMPIPLRRPFKAGLDRAVAGHSLSCSFLMGGEWYAPFEGLLTAPGLDALPGMVLSSWSADLLSAAWLDHYAVLSPDIVAPPAHPACVEAGLLDPLGVFSVFSVIPLVMLIDHAKLGDRPVPRRWSDLLDPCYARDISFGGWRANAQLPYQDYNEFLLLCLFEEFGAEGLDAFAGNVKHLIHNIRAVRAAGSGSDQAAAISILPWLQADICPRRDRTSVVWPEDGALAMPIGFVANPQRADRLRPLIDYVTGPDLGAVLSKNRYPPVSAAVADAFPPGARLKWLGWDHVRSHDMVERTRTAGRIFFEALSRRGDQ